MTSPFLVLKKLVFCQNESKNYSLYFPPDTLKLESICQATSGFRNAKTWLWWSNELIKAIFYFCIRTEQLIKNMLSMGETNMKIQHLLNTAGRATYPSVYPRVFQQAASIVMVENKFATIVMFSYCALLTF